MENNEIKKSAHEFHAEQKELKAEQTENTGWIIRIIGWLFIGGAALMLYVEGFKEIGTVLILAAIGGVILLIGYIVVSIGAVKGVAASSEKLYAQQKRENKDIAEKLSVAHKELEDARNSNDENEIAKAQNKIDAVHQEKSEMKKGRAIGWIVGIILFVIFIWIFSLLD